jgi:site-specific recombinase XerC
MTRQKTPVVLTREEVERLFLVTGKEEQKFKEDLRQRKKDGSPFLQYAKNRIFEAIRDQAILRLFFSTGIRLMELINLNDESVFLNESRVKVRFGKRGNDEYQPVTKEDTLKALRRYLKARRGYRYNKDHAFFIGRNGERVKPKAIQRALKRYAREAGILKNVYPHLLRHSFLSEYLRATGDIRRTQVAARHKNISSTQIYTHVSKEDVENGLREANL